MALFQGLICLISWKGTAYVRERPFSFGPFFDQRSGRQKRSSNDPNLIAYYAQLLYNTCIIVLKL